MPRRSALIWRVRRQSLWRNVAPGIKAPSDRLPRCSLAACQSSAIHRRTDRAETKWRDCCPTAGELGRTHMSQRVVGIVINKLLGDKDLRISVRAGSGGDARRAEPARTGTDARRNGLVRSNGRPSVVLGTGSDRAAALSYREPSVASDGAMQREPIKQVDTR